MPKILDLRGGIANVLFWSVISAAFIGPGTVTTASKAGATFGAALLWALTFSTMATIVLQETAARITLASGKSLGEIIAAKYGETGRRQLCMLLFLAIVLGCAAYEAGNILGAVAGLQLMINVPNIILTIIIGITSFALLRLGNFRRIAHWLGAMVAAMGLAFIGVAFTTSLSFKDLFIGSLWPSMPTGADLLIIGLIGTTIVPYNLFLASGIGKGQTVIQMRWGIALAILIGGIISMGILIAGTLVKGEYSFEAVSAALTEKLGPLGQILFGFGLFAAGLSSAITAPLAAAVTGQSLLGANDENWNNQGSKYKWVWRIVLGIGLAFGLAGVKPIPIIIFAQAVNGLLLPLVTAFLVLAVNDNKLIAPEYRNGLFANVFALIIVGVTTALGLHNLLGAWAGLFPGYALSGHWLLITELCAAALAIGAVILAMRGQLNARKLL